MSELDLCDVHIVDEGAVRAVVSEQADDLEITHLADTFQVLANPTRLRVVEALVRRELCLCDSAAVVGVSQSAVSHRLRQLRQLSRQGHLPARRAYQREITTRESVKNRTESVPCALRSP